MTSNTVSTTLNSIVRVKLTEAGKYHLESRSVPFAIGSDGSTAFLLWELIAHFGSMMHVNNTALPFVGNEVILHRPTEHQEEEDRIEANLKGCLRELHNYTKLQDGWDGERASKPDIAALSRATRFVEAILDGEMSTSIHADGSIFVECGETIRFHENVQYVQPVTYSLLPFPD